MMDGRWDLLGLSVRAHLDRLMSMLAHYAKSCTSSIWGCIFCISSMSKAMSYA